MTTLVVVLVAAAAAAAAAWLAARLVSVRAATRAAAEHGRHQRELHAAQTERARLIAALGGASDGLIVVDDAGRVVATNPAAQQLAALPPASVGRRLDDVLAWAALHRAIDAACTDGEVRTFELDGATTNGRVLAIRVQALPQLGTVISIDDTSRMKQLESLRRDFVANVSHELKTPLAAIQGFVETMLDDAAMPDETRQRFLERIHRQTGRLTTLVGDLLTLSRLDDDHEPLELTPPCDLAAVVADTQRDLAPLAERRGVALTGLLPDHAVWVRADREALRQIAGNLIDNAIKYTAANGRVHVAVTSHGARTRLDVTDTGLGLSPADQQRVFERFYRVDRARSRDVGGTGLGLAIVKNTVKGLGGEIGVQSRLGHGSTFWVELPTVAGTGEPDA